MNPIHPYRISIYNRITGARFAEYRSNQVPAKGDQISVVGDHRDKEDPFDLWSCWVVDLVVWRVSAPASQSAMAIAKQTGGYMADAACDWVELHVWPAEGPHWTKTPRFAAALRPSDDDEPDDGGAA